MFTGHDPTNALLKKLIVVCPKSIAIEAFCAIAKLVMSAKRKQDVLTLFDVLQGEASISLIQHLQLSLSDEHYAVVTQDSNRSAAKSWVLWWTRPKHLQMLAKPFAVMSSRDWDKAPRNTNGVERANCVAKSGGNKQSLCIAMQSLYEKDKCLLYSIIIAAVENWSKISYKDTSEEMRLA